MSDVPQGWAAFLDPDERIVWEGQPASDTFLLRPEDSKLIPFSLLWGGFALFWNVSVWSQGAPLFFQIFGLPFLVVGIYITIGRFFHDALRRRRTRYALSTRRALIATDANGGSIRTLPLQAENPLELKPGRNGSITIGPKTSGVNTQATWGFGSGAQGNFTFEFLPNPDQVYQTIRQLQRGMP